MCHNYVCTGELSRAKTGAPISVLIYNKDRRQGQCDHQVAFREKETITGVGTCTAEVSDGNLFVERVTGIAYFHGQF